MSPLQSAAPRPLARKIVTLYSLMAQQLSKADHYDFGLSSLRGVLVAAGALRRAHPDQPESGVLLKAICDVNMPRLVKSDVELVGHLIQDLFPGQEAPESPASVLEAALRAECAKAGLQPHPTIIQKAMELYACKTTRHCNMLVGRSLSGKSTVWKLLASALTTLSSSSSSTGSSGGSASGGLFNRVRVEVRSYGKEMLLG